MTDRDPLADFAPSRSAEAGEIRLETGVTPQARVCSSHAKLAQIEAALDRLNRGSFGYCVSCGAPISLLALDADPTRARCSRCDDQETP